MHVCKVHFKVYYEEPEEEYDNYMKRIKANEININTAQNNIATISDLVSYLCNQSTSNRN